MPSSSRDELSLAALSVLAAQPGGLGIASLEAAVAAHLGRAVQRRTLQRRLSALMAQGRVQPVGDSVARVYVATAVRLQSVDEGMKAPDAAMKPVRAYGGAIALSGDAQALRAQIRQPLAQRRPVGYQREFLERYEPNRSSYLPAALRAQLHDMGRTPLAGQQPAGTYVRDILARLLVDLSWASSRLEGNTYTRLDTQRLIEHGQAAEGKDAQETQMILNHKAAIEMLVDDAGEIGFNPFTLQNLHALLSQNLLHDDAAAGRLRRRPVDIAGTVFVPLAMPQVLEDCFRLLLAKASAIEDPFEQAFFLMVQLPYLQPFEDVNKRVSRVGANIPLIQRNLCPLSFIDVPEDAYIEGTLAVYELNRTELLRDVFVWAYERSCQRYVAITQSMAQPDPLKVRYRQALAGAVQTLVREQRRPSAAWLKKQASRMAPPPEREAVLHLLQEAIANLHEGSIARYGLKRSEYLAWQPQAGR
ncbi:Fic family protein [Ottowia sp.]|uniref:Fic family protein n=1 Tax=Ottowia sp. TaxID=1898956 RepID=UPI002CF45195|nr:Fic family protein [Ottowia sp.]HOB68119.1 Fic family protein [Ottowia sp.]HPZ58044.1 Fic family protein [Ottowia sp.]HQD48680.1 Fic family protein [Ottowia sp.]